LSLSPATADRLLKRARERSRPHGLSTTKPGTLLKHAIPILTFAGWDDAKPGFTEVDLVAHCGDSTRGEDLNSLRRLGVPRLSFVVNQASPLLDLEAIRAEAARTCLGEVAAVLPHNPRMMALASGGIFVLTYPEDPFTRQLWQLMSHLAGQDNDWLNEGP
jgi:hypothetical protein